VLVSPSHLEHGDADGFGKPGPGGEPLGRGHCSSPNHPVLRHGVAGASSSTCVEASVDEQRCGSGQWPPRAAIGGLGVAQQADQGN